MCFIKVYLKKYESAVKLSWIAVILHVFITTRKKHFVTSF